MTANQNPTQLEQLLFSLLMNPSPQQNGIPLPSNGNGNGMQLPTNGLLQLGGLLSQQQQQQPQLPFGQVDLRNLATAVGNFAQQPAGGQQQQQQRQQQQQQQQQQQHQYFKQAPPPPPTTATTTTTTTPASVTEKKDNGEDEKSLRPGTRMIPCRARRMPSAHNLLNAYFQVPEKVKHGEDLVCSFPACRNAGVKFRYCIHCKAPVAKRNFAKRHTHAHGAGVPLDSSMPKEDMDDEDESKQSKQSVQQRNNHQETSKKKEHSSDTIVTDKSSAGGNSGGGSSGNSATSFNNKKRSSESANKSNSAAKKAPNPPMLDEKRIQRWSELLANRPDTMDEHGMTLWIDEVMAVSDFRKSYLPEATFRARFSNESTEQLMKESSKPLKKRKRSKSKHSSSESRHSKKPASLKSNAPEGEKTSLKEAPEEQQQQQQENP